MCDNKEVSSRWSAIVVLGCVLGFFAMITICLVVPTDRTRMEISRNEAIKEALKQGRSMEEIKKIQEILNKN